MFIEGFAATLGPASLASPSPQVLSGILRPSTHLAIWTRRLPRAIDQCARSLAARGPFALTAEDRPDAAVDRIAAALPAAVPAAFLLDLLQLARLFTHLAGDPRLRLRLEALAGPGCHLWHADAVGLRLLCTYRGAGTEWLPMPGGAAAARQLRDGAPAMPAQRLATGDVALLKGEGFPGNRGAGLIHRAPPLRPGAPPRLLLCLDEAGRIPLE
ncbi:DUF1826 domain-containing protein [Falsiroseomonas tokyonensis]|uniref:DUF1826 domain-containing protein n=1 Tax=Falsiroseomonas tokyonensis TaxID=430521 RepID=A0ABV7C582_9PROT|nr:DUF1826 domain-containing protein [Falsiroseomonas tokyonensis]MBU8541582.1 DUF1826 domain-containing protein [Falsiroseomonas tokyonensis]